MTVDIIANYITAVLVLIGAIFVMVGGIGLLKFNDSMTRLHAPTKVGTMGVGSLLLASMLHSYMLGHGSFHELLIMAFLFVTAPISANFMAKVNLHRADCVDPPAPPPDDTWSTLNVPEADREIEER
jgi:multicomponent K+:H+ antiporter subunit G